MAIRVPSGAYYRRHRDRVPFLAQNNLLTFPYRWGFTPRSLRMLLEQAGLRVRETVGDVLVPTADEWTKPWARVEERLAKWTIRRLGRSPDDFPW